MREGRELEHSIVNLKSAGTEDFRDFRRFWGDEVKLEFRENSFS